MQDSDGDDWRLETGDAIRAYKITCVAFKALRLYRQERQAAAAAAAARLEALKLSMVQRGALQVWRAQVGGDESCQALLNSWSQSSSRVDTIPSPAV